MKRSSMHSLMLVIAWLAVFPQIILAQDMNRVKLRDHERANQRRALRIPDLKGYVTLKGDFHSHTVFSDGHVWPGLRIDEAWKEGLDVLAITDHIEYRPKRQYVKGDHNTSHEVAAARAEEKNIILIRGTEITRQMPPGHFNALFVNDVNPIEHEDPMAQLEEANRQGGFVIWNHPGWAGQQPDTTLWWDFHTEAVKKGFLHGIEVVNETEWYPVALDWCLDKDLTVFGNSDIHTAMDFAYDLSMPGSHRPMTLVFAKDRSEEGVREALFAGRTLAYLANRIMGKEDLITSLFMASVKLHAPYHSTERGGQQMVYRELENLSDLTFELMETGMETNEQPIRLLPHSIIILSHPEGEDSREYQLVNCWSGSRKHPFVKIAL